MWQIFNRIGEEILRSIAEDARGLAANEQMRRDAAFAASRLLGVDVSGPFVAPVFNDAYDKALRGLQNLVDASGEYPDEAADLVREKTGEFADSFAEALKKRNELKSKG